MAEAKVQFPVNLPPELKKRLEETAVEEGESQNEIVVIALEHYFAAKKKK